MQADILGHEVGGIVLCREGLDGARRVEQHLFTRRIVHIDDALVTDGEQEGLGLPVFLHGLVEIQMVLRQVGKRAGREMDAVHTV